MSLKGQVALVVGGASGIGLATAKELLQGGVNVTVCDLSAEGEAAVKALQAEFGPERSLFVKADVRDDVQMEEAFITAKKHFNRLDIVVNCAGICDDSQWSTEVDINLKGVIRGTLLAWKHMGKHEGGAGGTVVNIASVAGLLSMYVVPIYCGTKQAVIGFSRSCGEPYHLDRTGVRVLVICPGQTDTPILNNLKVLSSDLDAEMEAVRATYPMQPASNVAQGIVQVINSASSGSVWVSEEEKAAWEVAFPANYKDMCKK